MNSPRKTRLLARLNYLWKMEAFAAVSIPISVLIITRSLGQELGLESILANFIVSFFLIEGAFFWFLKNIQYKNNSAFPVIALKFFRGVYFINYGLLLAGILICFLSNMESGKIFISYNLIITFALLALAILEQINYFHWQLMYDKSGDIDHVFKHKRLKTGAIKKELIGLPRNSQSARSRTSRWR